MAQKWHQKATVQSSIAGGILAIIAAFIGLIPFFTKDNENDIKENITEISSTKINSNIVDDFAFNYTRLFGGYQVPFFLSDKEDDCGYAYGLERILGDTDMEFFQKWEYADSRKIKNIVYEELFSCDTIKRAWSGGGIESSFNLLRIANESDTITRKSFYYSSDVFYNEYDDIYEDVEKGKKKSGYDFMVSLDKEKIDRIIKNSQKIGFLILYIENTTDKTIVDIDLEFLEFKNNHIYPSFPSSENVENEFLNLSPKSKKLPLLRPKEKLQLMISIYLKNDKGYPMKYISSVVRPLSLRYRIQNTSEYKKQDIRLPLKDKAMKIDIPFGWYWQ